MSRVDIQFLGQLCQDKILASDKTLSKYLLYESKDADVIAFYKNVSREDRSMVKLGLSGPILVPALVKTIGKSVRESDRWISLFEEDHQDKSILEDIHGELLADLKITDKKREKKIGEKAKELLNRSLCDRGDFAGFVAWLMWKLMISYYMFLNLDPEQATYRIHKDIKVLEITFRKSTTFKEGKKNLTHPFEKLGVWESWGQPSVFGGTEGTSGESGDTPRVSGREEPGPSRHHAKDNGPKKAKFDDLLLLADQDFKIIGSKTIKLDNNVSVMMLSPKEIREIASGQEYSHADKLEQLQNQAEAYQKYTASLETNSCVAKQIHEKVVSVLNEVKKEQQKMEAIERGQKEFYAKCLCNEERYKLLIQKCASFFIESIDKIRANSLKTDSVLNENVTATSNTANQ